VLPSFSPAWPRHGGRFREDVIGCLALTATSTRSREVFRSLHARRWMGHEKSIAIDLNRMDADGWDDGD
jgi:hypothetical protein